MRWEEEFRKYRGDEEGGDGARERFVNAEVLVDDNSEVS